MERKEKICLIDGGLATELAETYGHTDITGDPLWSARLISTHPDHIALVHQSYLEAGCNIIETATYQASIEGLQRHLSVDFSKAVEIINGGVKICTQARDDFWNKTKCRGQPKPLVAGSLGPFGAHLADGSEYNGLYVDRLSTQELAEWHRPQIEAIWQSGVDLLAFETIPSLKEADAIVLALREFPDAKAWISFSCRDGVRTCHDEDFGDAVASLVASDQVIGCGVNCTAPWLVESLLGKIPSAIKASKKILAYPNSGQIWAEGKWKSEVPNIQHPPLVHYVDRWIELGASWIGGCCQVTPKDIALIRQAIDKQSESAANKTLC